MDTIKALTRYTLYTVLVAVLFSCNQQSKSENCGKFMVRNGTSEWNYGQINDVDSLQFHNKNHVTIYINGVKQEIHSDWIQVGRFSNCN